MKNSRNIKNRPPQPAPPFDLDSSGINGPNQIQYKKQSAVRPEARQIMAKSMEALVMAYLAANLDDQQIPLKDFMASFEKKLLLTCLRLTRGSQKNAAVILGSKPTVIFEKMRKHGIGRQQAKLSNELLESMLELAKQDLAGLEFSAATCTQPVQEQTIWQNESKAAMITRQIS